MQVLTATLKGQARQVTTKYGRKTVADIVVNGQEKTLWRKPNDDRLMGLQPGEEIKVELDGGKVTLIPDFCGLTATEKTTNSDSAYQPMNPETKREIASFVTDQAKLFGFCLQQASTIEGLPIDQRREVATTLFIQATRKFQLT